MIPLCSHTRSHMSCRHVSCMGRLKKIHRRIFLGLCLGIVFLQSVAGAQPFAVQGTGVNSNDFRVTVFASGLDFPLGMAKLPDDSLLVTLSPGANFFNSAGKLVRFTDTNLDGVADDAGKILYSNLPGTLTSVRVMDSLVFVTGPPFPITILRTGATPADPLTLVGKLILTYPGNWEHQHSELGLRRTPGFTNRYDLFFQIGSADNFDATTNTVTLAGENVPGATGILAGDSIYSITIIDDRVAVSATNLNRVASGVRNPAGFAIQAATGDFYFADNGIDGLVDANEPLSADELNFIARTNLGVNMEFFGFPTNYTEYRTGNIIGGAGVQPLITFEPQPDPFTGHESEGPDQITFAPPGFPAGLNTGIFLGFHGKLFFGGTDNEENPVVYADPATGAYFHFIEGQQPGIGHLDGLLASRDSLFVADLATNGNLLVSGGAGVIYQIKSLLPPSPPTLAASVTGQQIELTWDRGSLQAADEITGPWNDVPESFSPFVIQPSEPKKFYRTHY